MHHLLEVHVKNQISSFRFLFRARCLIHGQLLWNPDRIRFVLLVRVQGTLPYSKTISEKSGCVEFWPPLPSLKAVFLNHRKFLQNPGVAFYLFLFCSNIFLNSAHTWVGPNLFSINQVTMCRHGKEQYCVAILSSRTGPSNDLAPPWVSIVTLKPLCL